MSEAEIRRLAVRERVFAETGGRCQCGAAAEVVAPASKLHFHALCWPCNGRRLAKQKAEKKNRAGTSNLALRGL